MFGQSRSLVLMAVLASSSAALAAGDPSAGQTVFASHCAVCHSTQAGVNKIAPSLAGIVGSKSGTVAAFDFSPAMKDANITWDDNNAPATDKSKMKQGWPASQARQDRAQGRRLTGVYMEESHVSTGTSRSLDPWQWRGRQEDGLAYGAIGATDGRCREEVDRGLLSQYRLPPQQKRDLEREGRASGASRRPVRHEISGPVTTDMARVRQRKRNIANGRYGA